MVNSYIAYEINFPLFTWANDFTLANSLFGAVELGANADPGNHKHSGYDVGFDSSGGFTLGSGFDKNLIIFGVDMSSSVHDDNKKKIF